MKTRINEVVELIADSKNKLDRVIIQIQNADTNELYNQKFTEFDQELANYVRLNIEAHDLAQSANDVTPPLLT